MIPLIPARDLRFVFKDDLKKIGKITGIYIQYPARLD